MCRYTKLHGISYLNGQTRVVLRKTLFWCYCKAAMPLDSNVQEIAENFNSVFPQLVTKKEKFNSEQQGMGETNSIPNMPAILLLMLLFFCYYLSPSS